MTRAGIWDVAYDGDGEHEYASVTGAFAYGAEWAVGWVIAIVNMAQAIHEREGRHAMWRVVETDNFDGDYPEERFVGPSFRSREIANKVADLINGDAGGPQARRFWKVESEDYKLAPGFKP